MLFGGAESSKGESVERRAPGDAGVKPVKRKRSSRPVTAIKLRSSVGIHRELRTAGSTACQQRNQSNHVWQQPSSS